MGLAAVLQDSEAGLIGAGERVLTILCGANMDFAQFGVIARRAGIGAQQRRDYRVPIPEGRGTLVDILREVPPAMSIHDLQYGRTDSAVQHPVLGLLGGAADFAALDELFERRGVEVEDVSAAEDIGYRIIPFEPGLFSHPLFVQLEFPERPGAFLQFMEGVRDLASLCYFNYAYSGERVGRALVGMEFGCEADRDECLVRVRGMVGEGLRAVRPVSAGAFGRLTGMS
jgi:threonine dehydratase